MQIASKLHPVSQNPCHTYKSSSCPKSSKITTFGKSFSISKKECPQFSKNSCFSFITKTRFYPQLFEYFYKKYSYLGNKNVLSKLKTHFCSLLSNFWIKLHCQYQRFTQLGASKLRFLNKLTN